MILSIISVLMVAVYFTALRLPMGKVGWFWPVYIGYFLFRYFYLCSDKKYLFESPFKKNAFLPILFSALSLRTAEISFNIGLNLYGSTISADCRCVSIAFSSIVYIFP